MSAQLVNDQIRQPTVVVKQGLPDRPMALAASVVTRDFLTVGSWSRMKEPLAALSPPGVAVAIAIIGLIVIVFDLFHERAGRASSSTTALSALAAGATVSPTARALVAPGGGSR